MSELSYNLIHYKLHIVAYQKEFNSIILDLLKKIYYFFASKVKSVTNDISNLY